MKGWVLHKQNRFDAALLGSLGFSNRFIAQKTGLSQGQINYALRKADVWRMQFRNGESPEAKALLRQYRNVAESTLRDRWPVNPQEIKS